MSKCVVEKGVAAPKITRGRRAGKYPWLEMDVGDSFLVKGRTSSAMSAAATYAGKRYGMRLKCSTVPGGVRVWRIE